MSANTPFGAIELYAAPNGCIGIDACVPAAIASRMFGWRPNTATRYFTSFRL
jgi:hypothetical protein